MWCGQHVFADECVCGRRGNDEARAAQAFSDALEEIGDGAFWVLQCVKEHEDAIDDAGFACADVGAFVKELAA